MITEVVKYLILGSQKQLDQFFEKAQEEGCLEWISRGPTTGVEAPEIIHTVMAAIKILTPRAISGEGVVEDVSLAVEMAERIIELQEFLDKLQEEKGRLEGEKKRVAPLGVFSTKEMDYIHSNGTVQLQFFCTQGSASQKQPLPEEAIYIGTDYDLDYYLTVSKEPLHLPDMIEMRVEASVSELAHRINVLQDQIETAETELRSYVPFLDLLRSYLLQEWNQHALLCAKQAVDHPLGKGLFVVEAWIPRVHVSSLHEWIGQMDVHVEQIQVDPEEIPPTYIENRGLAHIGEDIMKIYDVPATTDQDPSSWVLWSFIVFFAVIVGDGGYGLFFLALALYMKRKFPSLVGAQKRMLKLLFLLSAGCVVWGVLTASYFGMQIAPGGVVSKLSPLNYVVNQKAEYHYRVKDDVYHSWLSKYPQIATAHNGKEMLGAAVVVKKSGSQYPIREEFVGNVVLEFTLILGILHITCGLLRYLKRNYAGLGWIFFMVGGYLFFPSILNATTWVAIAGWGSKVTQAAFGLQCLYGGIGFALIAALIQHRWKGLGEIANLIQVFADVLSYLRLYALSLAGSIMATTFNQEGAALGLAAGCVAVLLGHGINMVLSFMGGVIHGLRLNFLEWYHYCFDGGGRIFQPFQKLRALPSERELPTTRQGIYKRK